VTWPIFAGEMPEPRWRCIRTPMPWHKATGPDTANENQFRPRFDAARWVIGGSVNRLKTLDEPLQAVPLYTLEDDAIVMPDGWTRDPVTGRGIRADEMGLHDGFYVLGSTYEAPPTMEKVA
jgi:hypothetical protein